MKKLYTLCIFLFAFAAAKSQQVIVSGACIGSTPITLSSAGSVNGKPAYTGTGTVQGTSGVQVNLYWLSTSDNVWVLDFDGQPYFSNSDTSSKPPGTQKPNSTWQAVDGTTCTGSTPLSITGSVSLPVTLVNFSATLSKGNILLSWQTTTEINNKGFNIQRSTDGNTWSDLGFVNGAGNSSVTLNYKYTDANLPSAEKIYYRLLQQDFDGAINISNTVTVQPNSLTLYKLYNNPSQGNFKISFVNTATIGVYDISGRQILKKNVTIGENIIDLSSQSAGIYILRITRGSQIFSEKLIKQ